MRRYCTGVCTRKHPDSMIYNTRRARETLPSGIRERTLIKSEVINEGVWPNERLNCGSLRTGTNDPRESFVDLRRFQLRQTEICASCGEYARALFLRRGVCSCKYAPADGNLPVINRPTLGSIYAQPFQENNRATSLLLSDRLLDENVIYRCQLITTRVSTGAVCRSW